MQEFIFLIKGNRYSDESPEALERHMDNYRAWVKGLKDKGLFVKGNRLSDEGRHLVNKDTIISDGPFVESKEIIGGFVIIKSENIEKAIASARSCPLSEEFEILVKPLIPVSKELI